MGTPVKILEREMQCVGVGECISRPMTEEEKIKYGIKEKEEEKLSEVKIQPPEKEKLIGILAEVMGKTKAIHHAADYYLVSSTTIIRWIKGYGIEFDADGRVIVEDKAQEPEKTESILQDDTVAIQAGAPIIPKGEGNTIIITGQETKEIPKRLGYAEHDIGKATLQIDFRQELVKIISPSDNEMTFEEAIEVAELILDVLDNE